MQPVHVSPPVFCLMLLLPKVSTCPLPATTFTPIPTLLLIWFCAISTVDMPPLPPLPDWTPWAPLSDNWLDQTLITAVVLAVTASALTPLPMLLENTQLRAVTLEPDLACTPLRLPVKLESTIATLTGVAFAVLVTLMPSPVLSLITVFLMLMPSPSLSESVMPFCVNL